jgi:predicted transcriptional regulator
MPTATAGHTQAHRRILGDERLSYARNYVQRYNAGASIRQLATDTGRSYGFVHRVLAESGVKFRKRGGRRVRRTHRSGVR